MGHVHMRCECRSPFASSRRIPARNQGLLQSGIARGCTACQGHCRVLRNRGLLSSVFAQQASTEAIWWWMNGGSREGLAN